MKRVILTLFFVAALIQTQFSQSTFDVEAYKNFLNTNQDLSSSQLLNMHPAGLFRGNLNLSTNNILFLDSINIKYNLTDDEKNLLTNNGFMVTERLSRTSFGEAFSDIWHKDLPVFISSDAILHAIHMSYDKILKNLEVQTLIPKLTTLLSELKKQVTQLDAKYSSNPGMIKSLEDLDLYLTVAEELLVGSSTPYYTSNKAKLNEILGFIAAEGVQSYPLFSENDKIIDFSQFTVRGHYTDEVFPQLAKYFQSMMWLGRTEIYLISPIAPESPQQTFKDIQRQIVDAALVNEAINVSNTQEIWNEIDGVIKFMVGESDNVTLPNLQEVLSSSNVNNVDELLDSTKTIDFQNTLKTKSYAFQRILSQILITGFDQPDSIVPASAFLLFGQRFIIDSYVTSQVVFDKIVYNGTRPLRMLPSTLDILFALGNDAAAQLLQAQLDQYHYSSNLASLRYLIDEYDDDFWNVSLYNSWLNSIRKLNPPDDRETLPLFMQTAAWWQEKMNTQLASWAQLRHDNLLYAKQSYTGGTTCSYPYAYVEPIHDFYTAVSSFAKTAKEYFSKLPNTDNVSAYFDNVSKICDTLSIIADKELNSEKLTENEKQFLSKILYSSSGQVCGGPIFDGWYKDLFFSGEEAMLKQDLVVADIHTAPTDESGNMVGWVLHVGTGPVNLGVFTANTDEGKTVAFVGPVMSYYEHLSTNFNRLTDEEWADLYKVNPSLRPDFVNIYLANSDGSDKGNKTSLLTSVKRNDDLNVPSKLTLAKNFPNPFNPSTNIVFSIPVDLAYSIVKLNIYNIQGELITTLVDEALPAGNYITKWNGTDNFGNTVSSGVYLYQLVVGTSSISGKMTLMK